MRTPVTLVTGAGGEIGHGLIDRLAPTGRPIVTIDVAPLVSDLLGIAPPRDARGRSPLAR